MQRIFVDGSITNFIIKDNDLYHLQKVLRIKSGDEIECVFEGSIYLCSYTEQNGSYSLNIIKKLDNDPELNKNIELYQALIRNENFELVIQKATELGVNSIYPTVFKRNVVIIDSKKESSKIERFNKIVESAAMQSHRLVIPKVNNQIDIKNIELNDGEIGIVCYEKEENVKSLHEIENIINNAKTIKVVIGPEGGFERYEYDSLLQKGFISVSLGKRILRSETAAINILSKLNYIIEKE